MLSFTGGTRLKREVGVEEVGSSLELNNKIFRENFERRNMIQNHISQIANLAMASGFQV